MAQFKAKLTQQSFPFNFTELAGTVLVSSALEQNLQAAGSDALQEIPQSYFMQNVLPTQRGFISIHYTRVIAEHTYPRYLDKIFTLYDIDGNIAIYSTAYGQRYVYAKDVGAWVAFPLPPEESVGETSVAYLKGTTYILIAGVGLFKYNFGSNTFDELTTIAVTAAATNGVVAASQYLLLWDANTVYWSSPLNPLDFTPITGAGGSTSILSNRSRILLCLPVADGFIAYTTRSAIHAAYTGNPNFPFTFKEIAGSAGVAESEHVAYDAPNDRHIAWTTSGFQLVTQKGASPVWPELSDSIAQGLYSSAGNTGYPSIVKSANLLCKVSNIGARFIAVSIKRNSAQISYNHAYIYDIALDRWGRLDIPHIDFFEYRAPEFVASYTYAQLVGSYDSLGTLAYEQLIETLTTMTPQFGFTLGCVGANGAIHIALPSTIADIDSLISPTSGAKDPSIFFGRYRLQRQAAVQFQQMQLSNAAQSGFNVRVIAHDAAGNKSNTVTPVASVRQPNSYTARATGAHVSLQISGKFNLTSLEAEITSAGGQMLPVKATAIGLGLYNVVVNTVPVVIGGEYVEVTP